MRQPQSAQENVGALVIGGDYRGLGIVRSLGRHGIPVWVLADEHRIATVSRYAVRSLSWPERDEEQLQDLLQQIDEDLVWSANVPREDFIVTVYQGREVGVYSDPRDDEDEDEIDEDSDQGNGRRKSS